MTAEIQRPLRGSRISSFYPVKSLPSLSSLDSAFQLQEYISLLIRLDVHDVNAIVSLPNKASEAESKEEGKEKKEEEGGKEGEKEGEKEKEEGGKEVAVDEACWIYEQLRRLAQDLTHPLITTLQQECTRASCPEMKAGEWLYLCVAHGNDGAMEQCCAIDYILHTLDSATALLNSPRAFPSRLQIPQTSHRHFSSLARRLGRIFAHAYFHHREAFEQAEAESSLYARFLALTYKFHLVPAEFLVIPSSAVGFGEEEFGRHELEEPIGHGPGLEERERGQQGLGQGQGQAQQVLLRPSHTRDQTVGPHGGRKSKSPPLLGLGPAPLSPGGDISPRRVGRNRTDTMVHSDARDLVEDLANRFNAEVETEEPELEQEELELGGSKTARPGEEFGRGEEVEGEDDDEVPPTPTAEKVDDVVIVKEQQEEEGKVEEVEVEVEVPPVEIEEPKEEGKAAAAPATEASALVDAPSPASEEKDESAPKEEDASVPEPEAAPAPVPVPALEAVAVEEESKVEEIPAVVSEEKQEPEHEHEKTFAEAVKESVEPAAVEEEAAPVPVEEKVETEAPVEEKDAEVSVPKVEVEAETPAPAEVEAEVPAEAKVEPEVVEEVKEVKAEETPAPSADSDSLEEPKKEEGGEKKDEPEAVVGANT